MTWKAYVQDHQWGRGVEVGIVDENVGGRSYVLNLGDEGQRTTELTDGVALDPTLRLTDEQARALLQGLLSHFQGGDDTRALRRDYDAERARVDKLIDSHVSALQSAAHPLRSVQ